MRCPPALRPGDTVYVVAPSSPFDRALALRGMGWLASRYRVRFSPRLFETRGYLAGSDETRAAELREALQHPEVRALVAVRGGYGANRILGNLDFDQLARNPRWLVGFSDITALHLEAARHGVASLHAEHVTGLGRADHRARSAWAEALERPLASRTFLGEAWTGGSAEGPLVGGNLAVLASTAPALRFELPHGALVFLEEVGETSYRVDRLLTQLLESGFFDGAGGIALGHFTNCSAGKFSVPVEEVLRERLLPLRVPVLSSLPFGHERPNWPLLLGATTRLDTAQGCLRQGFASS